jgi:hypothetical protein
MTLYKAEGKPDLELLWLGAGLPESLRSYVIAQPDPSPRRLVYRPAGLDPEMQLRECLDWLDANGYSLDGHRDAKRLKARSRREARRKGGVA